MLSFVQAIAGGSPHTAQDAWQFWSLEPGVIAGLLITSLLYALGWRALARRTGKPGLTRRAWFFAGGIFTLFLALVSPLGGLADEFFSAHMAQHMLLILVAAPLLVLSYPLPALILSLPDPVRRAIGRGWRKSGWLRAAWRAISQPLVAWLLQVGILWAWHDPGLYQAAVDNETIHALEHISFLVSALLFWWVALHTFGSRRAQRGIGILYLFTAALQGGVLGALLVFSPRVWYPVYIGRAQVWGLSALADQQLAGSIMGAPAGLVYLLAALLMMKHWLRDMEAGSSSSAEQSMPGKIID